MAAVDSGVGLVWPLVFVLGLGTFALRLSFIQLQAWIDGLPSGLEAALAFVPPAVLAALIAPELVVLDGSLVETVGNPRAVAGAVALVVAWRTGSMIATIAVGMGVLWGIPFLLG